MPNLNFQNGESYNVNNGVATAANPTASAALGNLGVSSYSGYVPPTTSQPVASSQLTQPPANIPPTTPLPDPTGSGLAAAATAVSAPPAPAPTSATPNLDLATSGDYSQDPGYQQASSAYNQSVTNYQQAANAQPNSADLFNSALDSTGANADQAVVNSLRTQLAASQAKYMDAAQQAETSGITSGAAGITYQGQQAAIQRQGAVEQGALAAQLQAAQGNYDAAEKLAEQTSTLQFQDAQRKIDNLKSFIDINQNNLSQAEKVAVSKMSAQATQQQKQLDQQKEARTFAIANNISAPFYTMDGQTVIRTSDGEAFSTPAEALKAGVNTTTWNNVQHLDASQKAVKFETKNLGTTKNPNYVHIGYSAAGNIVSQEPIGGTTSTVDGKTVTTPAPKKTTSSTTTTTKDSVITQAGDYINQNTGQDGYVDPRAYQYALSKLPTAAVAGFKAKYKNRLSPEERKRLGA